MKCVGTRISKAHIMAVVSFLALWNMPAGSFAAEPLTLKEAMAQAYKNNPRMIDARKGIEAAQGERLSSWALPDPEIEFDLSGLKKNEAGERNVNLGELDVRQRFDPPGVLFLKGGIAALGVSAREQNLRSVWGTVYADVRRTYSRISLNARKAELATESLDIMRKLYARVQLRFQSGQALKNEMQRAKIEVFARENDVLLAEKNLKTAKAILNDLLGRPIDTPFDIEDGLKEESLQTNYQELLSLSLQHHPVITTETLQLEASGKQLLKEGLGALPSPFVGFQRITESYDNDYQLVLGMSVPLWGFNQGEVMRARAQKSAQEARLEAAKRRVFLEAYQSTLDVELAQKQQDLLNKSLEEADGLLRLADQRYSEGEIDFINYLDQVKTSIEVRVRYYEGLYNLSAAITALEEAIYATLRKEGYLK